MKFKPSNAIVKFFLLTALLLTVSIDTASARRRKSKSRAKKVSVESVFENNQGQLVLLVKTRRKEQVVLLSDSTQLGVTAQKLIERIQKGEISSADITLEGSVVRDAATMSNVMSSMSSMGMSRNSDLKVISARRIMSRDSVAGVVKRVKKNMVYLQVPRSVDGEVTGYTLQRVTLNKRMRRYLKICKRDSVFSAFGRRASSTRFNANSFDCEGRVGKHMSAAVAARNLPVPGQLTQMPIMLVNGANGQDIIPIADGDAFDMKQVGDKLTLRAAPDSVVGSVRFELTGPKTRINIENFPPYSLNGDRASKPKTYAFVPGDWTINVKFFDTRRARGAVLGETTINFTLVDGDAAPEEDPAGDFLFTLVNAALNKDIRQIKDGATIDLTKDGQDLNIVAVPNVQTESAVITLNGPKNNSQTENFTPFSLAGDRDGDYNVFSFVPGVYQLTVEGFNKDDGKGTSVAKQEITFTVTNGGPVTQPTPVPTVNVGATPTPNPIPVNPNPVSPNGLPPELLSPNVEFFVGQFELEEGCPATDVVGTAMLMLNREARVGGLTMSYTGLDDLVAQHVHDQNTDILWDLDEGVDIINGVYIWRMEDKLIATVPEILQQLDAGLLYVNLHSPECPRGETKAILRKQGGGEPVAPSGSAEVARFLNQATFGATPDLVAAVEGAGLQAYLDSQFAVTDANKCMLLPTVQERLAGNNDPDHMEIFASSWWVCALNSPVDELCHRTAFALSQQWVVSGKRPETENAEALAVHHDILKRNCFGNLRTLMEEVTLSAPMGVYLDMLNNDKASPNENFAREIMQLFTIGQDVLLPDGTKLTDPVSQLPRVTYEQQNIVELSKVLTGWTWGDQAFGTAEGSWTLPMQASDEFHDVVGDKEIFIGGLVPEGGTAVGNMQLVLDQLFNHTSFCPFTSKRLIQQFVKSNPSPDYIGRVSAACDNNGQGVRGDLRAMVSAVLLDDEARNVSLAERASSGRLRQPTMIAAHLMKLFRSNQDVPRECLIEQFEGVFQQTPLHPETVFNFFQPEYAFPGVIANANLLSPEFETLNQSTLVERLEYLWGAIDNDGFECPDATVPLDMSSIAGLSPEALADFIDSMLTGGAFARTSNMASLVQVINGNNGDAKMAVKAAIASTKHMIQK